MNQPPLTMSYTKARCISGPSRAIWSRSLRSWRRRPGSTAPPGGRPSFHLPAAQRADPGPRHGYASSRRAFIGTIIEYPVSSILLQTEETLTLAVGSRLTLYEQDYLWGDFAAATVLSGLPITVVFLVAQRWLVSGLTAGAVKG